MEFNHTPVLLQECIDGLKINPDGIYVDGTMGGAGHSSQIAKNLSSKGTLIGIDRDTEALAASKKRLANRIHKRFASLLAEMERLELSRQFPSLRP